MTESSATQGTVMMVVGALMVVVAVVTVLVTSEPLPVTVAIIGIVFLAVGARKRRSATRL
jgi:xanthosine utilization system XapX-like protein